MYYKSIGKWWDFYNQETVVVWDDFRGCSYQASELFKLCDRYPYKVERKGNMCEFNSELIIFTSNVEPEDLYEGNKGEPFMRRIEYLAKVLKLKKYEDELKECVIEEGMKVKRIDLLTIVSYINFL